MQIASLPAGSGDCFVITWGNPTRAMLIDGGRAGCYNNFLKQHLAELLKNGIKKFELAVVTHIDEDHMEGLIKWVESGSAAVDDFWFNGRPQLTGIQLESVKQGDDLSQLLHAQGVPWNKKFSKKAVMAAETGAFPSVTLSDGMRVTVIAPGPHEMKQLSDRWNKEVPAAGILVELMKLIGLNKVSPKKPPAPTPIQLDEWAATQWKHKDVGATNVSSITCMLEHGGKSALFTGDADPVVVVAAWKRLQKERGGPVHLDLLKLNHHGSRNNCSPELIQTLRPRRVLVSSDGSLYGHPEKEALSYVIEHAPGVQLLFNYDNAYSQPWTAAAAQTKWGYSAKAGGANGVVVQL